MEFYLQHPFRTSFLTYFCFIVFQRGQLNYGGPPSWGTAAAAAAVAAYSCSVRTSNSLPNLSHNQRQLQVWLLTHFYDFANVVSESRICTPSERSLQAFVRSKTPSNVKKQRDGDCVSDHN